MKKIVFVKAIGCVLLAGLSLVGQPVSGADANSQYRVLTIDVVKNCEALNAAAMRAKTQDDWGALYGFSLYTMGYLTGINRLAYDTHDIAGKKNVKTLMVWLERYCREHPKKSFDYALHQLVAVLYPVRVTSAPQ